MCICAGSGRAPAELPSSPTTSLTPHAAWWDYRCVHQIATPLLGEKFLPHATGALARSAAPLDDLNSPVRRLLVGALPGVVGGAARLKAAQVEQPGSIAGPLASWNA